MNCRFNRPVNHHPKDLRKRRYPLWLNADGILVEIERGEDSDVSDYRKALELDLPANLREIVQRQSAAIKAAHDRVRELRDSGVSW